MEKAAKMSDKRCFREYIDRTTLICTLIGFIIILLMGFGVGTMASKNNEVRSDNIISSGQIKTKILNLDENGNEFPKLVTGIMPGQVIPNFVYAKNTDTKEAQWVRIKPTLYVTDSDGSAMSAEDISLQFNTDDWTLGDDGYYYYLKPLEPGATSECLYSAILIGTSIGNEYRTAELTVNLQQDATQVVNNGDNPLEAVGWNDN